MRRDEIFERLEPPPGGLAQLRARLAAPPRRVTWRLAPLAFALVAIAVAVFLVLRPRGPDLQAAARARGDLAAVELGFAPPPTSPLAIADEQRETTAVSEVRTANPNVVFYWVASTEWEK